MHQVVRAAVLLWEWLQRITESQVDIVGQVLGRRARIGVDVEPVEMRGRRQACGEVEKPATSSGPNISYLR
jgi:hypothetical protein